jgi:hypothetical protein
LQYDGLIVDTIAIMTLFLACDDRFPVHATSFISG